MLRSPLRARAPFDRAKFFSWKKRYGKVDVHDGWIPRDRWIGAHEREAMLEFRDKHPLEGYSRLAFMMIENDVVYGARCD